MLRDFQSNGPTLICTGGAQHPHIHLAPHFLHSLDFMAPTPSGALSPRAAWACAARLGDSRRRGDSWSLLPKVDPPSSLKNKRPGQQPAARGWETCFKICACRPCHHAGSGKQAALGQNSFANQSCFREAGGVSAGPLCRDQARMTTSECEWKNNSLPSMSTAGGPRYFYLKITLLSRALKASLGHQENPSFKIY